MRLVFQSRKETAIWSFSLLFLLLLPFFIPLLPGYGAHLQYLGTAKEHGDFHYIKHEIFDETEDIDILILGSCLVWSAIDSNMIQTSLEKELGRKARVVNLGYLGRNEESNLMIIDDILKHRKVKMLLYEALHARHHQDEPAPKLYRWWNFSERFALSKDFDPLTITKLYSASVLGGPRQLVEYFFPTPTVAEFPKHSRWILDGSTVQGFEKVNSEFKRWASSNLLFSDQTSQLWRFHPKPSQYQTRFLRKINSKILEIPTIMVNIPTYEQRSSDMVEARLNYAAAFNRDIPMIGIAPTRLFMGMSSKDVAKYYSKDHLNSNGAALFTTAIMETLIEGYKRNVKG